MKLTTHTSNIITIRQGDKNFIMADGFMVSPRAGFEINQKCPQEYKQVIATCIDRGWLRPVAFVKEKDFMWEKLCD